MESLILLIIFGLSVAYFATQNTGSVHLLLGNYLISSIPMYVVVVGSILFGVFVSWLISMVNTISTVFTLHGKDSALKNAEKEIEKLQEKNHELEMKLVTLTGENTDGQEEKKEKEDVASHPSLLHHVKKSLGLASG